jgi:hypothetical protein
MKLRNVLSEAKFNINRAVKDLADYAVNGAEHWMPMGYDEYDGLDKREKQEIIMDHLPEYLDQFQDEYDRHEWSQLDSKFNNIAKIVLKDLG